MASEKQKMLAGELYIATGEELAADARRVAEWMDRYNASIARTQQEYRTLLREMLAEVGEGAYIRPPFHCGYGYNISLGKGVFLNFNCVILDVVKVTIGEGTQIGPGTQILTADHPRDPVQRRAGLEFGRPVTIAPTSGSVRRRSSCRASRSATTRSSERAPWSRATWGPVLRWSAIRRRSVKRDGHDGEHSGSRRGGARAVRAL